MKVENTRRLGGSLIVVTVTVPRHANRRFAGHDIKQGNVLLHAGQIFTAVKIMPLISAGVRSVPVATRPRVGIWSTGKELVNQQVNGINGPSLLTAARNAGAKAKNTQYFRR
jgi:molybdopterin molybdotransferase